MFALIIDGYVDEPACFGVPPYISPYARYCAGTLMDHGAAVKYVTCDFWRANRQETDEEMSRADMAVVIMGLTVPGRYRGGSPLTLRELCEIGDIHRRGALILGGPIRSGYALKGGARARDISPACVDFIARGDLEASLDIFCGTGEWIDDAQSSYSRIDEIAPLGAEVVRQHPSYPDVIAEMELSRGCDRLGERCSFCTEGMGRPYEERGLDGIAGEFAALSSAGVKAFRLGRCANLLAWGGDATPEGVRPNRGHLSELYSAIRSSAPNLEVLHADNCNPLTIEKFPRESAECLSVIAKGGTEGDGLSLGIESVDPAVVRANSLKVTTGGALLAVRLINEAGGYRETPSSMPSLLPGINFLFGLAGETRESLELNRDFLLKLMDEGLSVRRINIRRAILFKGSELERRLSGGTGKKAEKNGIKDRDYMKWKDWVREEIDPVMLERVAPNGTIIRNVIAEERKGNIVFGRPLGSYPPLVGVISGGSSAILPNDKIDAMVTGGGGRSLTAVPYPLDINSCGRAELMSLPEIGKARAEALILKRPYNSPDDIIKTMNAMDTPKLSEKLMRYFTER